MKKLAALLVISLFFIVSQAQAEVRSNVLGSISLDGKPLDMASSADGKVLYVLTPGKVSMFSLPDGKLIGTVVAEKGRDRIAASPAENLLLLGSSDKESVSIVRLDLVRTFDTTGSPFRGPAGAPVTIVVFSDFQ